MDSNSIVHFNLNNMRVEKQISKEIKSIENKNNVKNINELIGKITTITKEESIDDLRNLHAGVLIIQKNFKVITKNETHWLDLLLDAFFPFREAAKHRREINQVLKSNLEMAATGLQQKINVNLATASLTAKEDRELLRLVNNRDFQLKAANFIKNFNLKIDPSIYQPKIEEFFKVNNKNTKPFKEYVEANLKASEEELLNITNFIIENRLIEVSLPENILQNAILLAAKNHTSPIEYGKFNEWFKQIQILDNNIYRKNSIYVGIWEKPKVNRQMQLFGSWCVRLTEIEILATKQTKVINQNYASFGQEMKDIGHAALKRLHEIYPYEDNYESNNYILRLIETEGFEEKAKDFINKINNFDKTDGSLYNINLYKIHLEELSKYYEIMFAKSGKGVQPSSDSIIPDTIKAILLAGATSDDAQYGKFVRWIKNEYLDCENMTGDWKSIKNPYIRSEGYLIAKTETARRQLEALANGSIRQDE